MIKQYTINEEQLKSLVDELAPEDSNVIADDVRSHPLPSAQDTTGQCENCKNKGKRSCMYHGYSNIPLSCNCKIGDMAEEALRNLNGTFIDVWTLDHDEKIRQDATEKVLDEVYQRCMEIREDLPTPDPPKIIYAGQFEDVIEALRKKEDPGK